MFKKLLGFIAIILPFTSEIGKKKRMEKQVKKLNSSVTELEKELEKFYGKKFDLQKYEPSDFD